MLPLTVTSLMFDILRCQSEWMLLPAVQRYGEQV